ncbi:uncharacterized protein LOC134969862 isoform X3 [Pseudophryne corroboree]|uniref:uncharacterized protein LOC134969862 isoform X3 n=1 Tax=Pseudophryne corroboree TaxID=495146 RepID=UPI00308134E8
MVSSSLRSKSILHADRPPAWYRMKTLLCIVLLSALLPPAENSHHDQERVLHKDQGHEMMDSSGGKPDEKHGLRKPRSLEQLSGLANIFGSSSGGQKNMLSGLAQTLGLSGSGAVTAEMTWATHTDTSDQYPGNHHYKGE